MGSYNTMGFISNLPICGTSWGEQEVVLILLNHNDGRPHGTCNANSWYTPMFTPIRGTYDGYGSIKDIVKTDGTRWIENFFDDTIDNLLQGVSEQRGYVTPKNNDIYQNLYKAIELSEVYDKMSNDYKLDWDNYDLREQQSLLNHVMLCGDYTQAVVFPPGQFFDKSKGSTMFEQMGLGSIPSKDIVEFIQFDCVVRMDNHRYVPCHGGSQDDNLLKIYETLSFYRNIISNQLNDRIECSGDEYNTEGISRIKSMMREENIELIFESKE